MLTVTMCRGLVASGKSTWAKSQAAATGALRWNNDDYCEMLTGRRYGRVDGRLLAAQRRAFIHEASARRADIIIDNTNLNPYTTVEVEQALATNYVLVDKFFPVALDVAQRRNDARDIPVPAHVIDNMHAKWIATGHWPQLDV